MDCTWIKKNPPYFEPAEILNLDLEAVVAMGVAMVILLIVDNLSFVSPFNVVNLYDWADLFTSDLPLM